MKTTRRHTGLLALLLLAASPAFVHAQESFADRSRPAHEGAAERPGVSWSNLSSEQRKVLSRYEGQWEGLPPEKQRSLSRGSQRWLNMSPDERKNAKSRFNRWSDLPPNQRRQMRNRWEQFRSLPPNQQQEVRQNFRKFKNIPPERRRRLQERWQSATPEERQMMLERMREQRQRGRNFSRPAPRRP